MHDTAMILGTIVFVEETQTKGQNPKPLLTIAIETDANERGYKDLVAVETTKFDRLPQLSRGMKVAAKYTAKSREYQGRYFTNLSLLELQVVGASAAQATRKQAEPKQEDFGGGMKDSEVPF